uniref:5_nucleotid_C domain-containing protein n=1 Tax=Macrostomum lignano TaxID=282301 RepID=A0A1I8JNU7_9PLAT
PSYNGNNFSHLELYTDPTGRELVLVAQKKRFDKIESRPQPVIPDSTWPGMPNCHLAPMDNYIRAVDIVNGSMLAFLHELPQRQLRQRPAHSLGRLLLVNTTAVAEVLSESVDGLLCRNPESDIFLTVSDRSLGRGGSVPDALYLTMPFCASRRDKIEATLAIVDPQTLRKFAVLGGIQFFPSRDRTGAGCGTLKGRDEVDCVGRAAAVAPAGRHLARHLNISSTSDTEVLFLTSSHNNRSGVCAVRMLQVDQLLDLILDDCRQGRPQALYGPTYLRDELPCSQVNGASGSGGASSSARGIWAGIVSANPDRVIRAPFMAKFPSLADEVTAVFGGYKTWRSADLLWTLLG